MCNGQCLLLRKLNSSDILCMERLGGGKQALRSPPLRTEVIMLEVFSHDLVGMWHKRKMSEVFKQKIAE